MLRGREIRIVAYSYDRGHKIIWLLDKEIWIYEDTKKQISGRRPCIRCGKSPTKEGHDACLGKLESVKNACCGHGVEKGYVQYI